MMKFKLAALAFALVGHTAMAQVETSQATGYVGALVGYADPTGMDGSLGYGVTIGMMFPNGFSGNIWGLSTTTDTNSVDVTLIQYGLGVDYALSGLLGDRLAMMKAGLKIGMSTVDVDAPGVDEETDFVWGPSLSADWMMASAFSLGGEANLLFQTSEPGYSVLYLMVTGKYWF